MGQLQIVPSRLHRVGPNVRAVCLTGVRVRSEWVASLYVKHNGPAGRNGLPWQLADRYGRDGAPVNNHDEAAALIHWLAGERRLPGVD